MNRNLLLLFCIIVSYCLEIYFFWSDNIRLLFATQILTIVLSAIYYFYLRKSAFDNIDAKVIFFFILVVVVQYSATFSLEKTLPYFPYLPYILQIFTLLTLLNRRRIIFINKETPKNKLIHFAIITIYCLVFYGNFKQKTINQETVIIYFFFSILISLISVITTLRNSTEKSYNLIVSSVYFFLISEFFTSNKDYLVRSENIYYFDRLPFLIAIFLLVEGLVEDRNFEQEKRTKRI